QLKAAILKMPAKEKDKLLLRLATKDAKLIRRLHFELLEGGETRDDRAAELREQIRQSLHQVDQRSTSPGYLLLYLRHWNARITEHVQATKDKPGEVTLTVFMLAEAFRTHWDMLRRFPDRRSDTFAPYVLRRAKTLLGKAEKLHEDYFIEFRRDLNELLQFIWDFRPTAQIAKNQELPKRWEM
ncbi:MAG: hypothetical protein ABIQ93_04600, partial [Saprospiraceae bacterium]